MLFRYLYFVSAPPEFKPPEFTLPPTAHRLRHATFDQAGVEVVPSWMADLPPQPTVFATLGTEFNHTPGIFSRILSDLSAEPINLILTVGRDRRSGGVRAAVHHGPYRALYSAVTHPAGLYCGCLALWLGHDAGGAAAGRAAGQRTHRSGPTGECAAV